MNTNDKKTKNKKNYEKIKKLTENYKLYLQKCRDWKRKNKQKLNKDNNETYYFYKGLGICVSCHSDDAMIGSVRCPECANKASERYYKSKQSPNFNKRRNSSNKKRYYRLRNSGICCVCGKRKAEKKTTYCYECYIRKRRKMRDNWRNKHPIPRDARASFGLCFICGEPVYKNYKLCYTHYKNLESAREKYQTSRIESGIELYRETRKKKYE
jgi:hypothetical protein